MENSLVKISSNWTQIGGCPMLSQTVQLLTADPDLFIKPKLDDIVDEEKSILLSKENFSDYCELYIELHSRYKIQSVSLVCNVSKVEVFQGAIREYFETIYGVSVDEFDDQFRSYRYDIEVQKSGITNLTLKFLTKSNEVCIFGTILYIAPNPNGITTLLPNSDCTNSYIKNIFKKLPSKEVDENSKICEQLLEHMEISNILSNRSKVNNLTDTFARNPTLEQLSDKTKIVNKEPPTHPPTNYEIVNQLKLYIDERLNEIEQRLYRHLEKMEERQMNKLSDILNIIEKLK